MKTPEKKKIGWRHTVKNNAYVLKLLWKACPWVIPLTLLDSVLGALHSFIANTYLFKYALNALQEGLPLQRILITIGLMLSFSLVHIIVSTLTSVYRDMGYMKVDLYFQAMFQKKAAQLDLACYENAEFYDTYVKAVDQGTNRTYGVLHTVSNALWLAIELTATGILMFTIDPVFILIAALPLVFNLITGKWKNRTYHEKDMRTAEVARQRDYVRRTFYLNDFSKEMRLTQMWKVMYRRMESSVKEMKDIARHYGYRIMFYRALFDFVMQIAVYMGAMVLAAFKTLVAKTMLLGDCFVIINSISNLSGAINHVGTMFLKADENALYIDNLRSFLEYEVNIAEDENAPAVTEFQSLELQNVSFSYNKQSEPVLSDINLTICAGEKIAPVGHNGAGKTTLIKLLQRLYDPTEGQILVNGSDIREVRLSSYRALFGTVFQDYQLFSMSVGENVLLRGPLSPEDREIVTDALQKAGVYERVCALPNGMDTTVTREFDEEGAVFSGGEAQKIAIARIFAGNHEIVIMDEPTSALDPIAEQEMYRNMFAACQGKTVIFISHRLSSATMADRVYLFENGRIIEEGTHSQLVAINQKYADMWHKQADIYTQGEEVAV